MKKALTLGVAAFIVAAAVVYTPISASHASAAQTQTQFNLMYRFRNQDRYITNYSQLYAFLEELIQYLNELQGQTSGTSEVDVATVSATNVMPYSALLRGRIDDFGSSNYADVWFEFGKDNGSALMRTSSERIDDNDNESFSRTVGGLAQNTSYRFRAVARDDNGDIDRGSFLSFDTGRTVSEDTPDVTTQSATDVTDDSAVLRGTVDMRDFDSGTVFFVYGEDERLVDDVADYDRYSDIDEEGSDLQKVSVDSDLDGEESYTKRVSGLDNDRDIFHRTCVAYENDGDDRIECGSVRSFTTDR